MGPSDINFIKSPYIPISIELSKHYDHLSAKNVKTIINILFRITLLRLFDVYKHLTI